MGVEIINIVIKPIIENKICRHRLIAMEMISGADKRWE